MEDSTAGDRVRKLRELRGMTQINLRRPAGLPVRTVKDVAVLRHCNPRNQRS
jgi:hypothetical protein